MALGISWYLCNSKTLLNSGWGLFSKPGVHHFSTISVLAKWYRKNFWYSFFVIAKSFCESLSPKILTWANKVSHEHFESQIAK